MAGTAWAAQNGPSVTMDSLFASGWLILTCGSRMFDMDLLNYSRGINRSEGQIAAQQITRVCDQVAFGDNGCPPSGSSWQMCIFIVKIQDICKKLVMLLLVSLPHGSTDFSKNMMRACAKKLGHPVVCDHLWEIENLGDAVVQSIDRYMTRQAFCVLRTDDIGAANRRCMRYIPILFNSSGDFWSFNPYELSLQLHDGVGTANVKLWTIGGSKEMRQSSGRIIWITSRIWQDVRFFFEAWHIFRSWWAHAKRIIEIKRT